MRDVSGPMASQHIYFSVRSSLSPPRQALCNDRPLVPVLPVPLNHPHVLLLAEVPSPQRGVKLVAPPQAAALPPPASDAASNEAPVARTVLTHELGEERIFLEGGVSGHGMRCWAEGEGNRVDLVLLAAGCLRCWIHAE